jgi:hypothetical protein
MSLTIFVRPILFAGIGLVSAASFAGPLELSVSPATTFIVAGTGKTCVDRAHTTNRSDPHSLTGNRVNWQSLKLEWASSDTLSVVAIQVTISHPMIAGGTYITSLDREEIEYLLGAPGGEIAGAKNGTTKVIETRDPDRAAGTILAGQTPSCGLAVGGIQLATSSPMPFTATARIEIIGFTTDKAGIQSPVRQSTQAMVEFF